MPNSAREYRKLPGIGRDVATYSRLYLGPGHLLVVNSTGFTESYKRFYFQDIQAIVLCRTRSRLIWNIILSVPLLLCMSVVIMGIADISEIGRAHV